MPEPLTEQERRGGPIRRTYRRVRVRISHFRHGFADAALSVQILGVLVAAGLVVGGFFGAKGYLFQKNNPNGNAFLSQAKDIQALIPDKAANQKRVLVAGDFTTVNLANASDVVYSTRAFEGLLTSVYGCGIADTTQIFNGKLKPYPDPCRAWKSLYHDNTHFFVPDVSVLMTGTTERFPVVVGGQTLQPGTVAFERYLVGRIDAARASLGGSKTPFVLLGPLCVRTPTGGPILGLGVVLKVWQDYAKSHKGVSFVNLAAFACPGGRSAFAAPKKPILNKARQFTKEGAFAVWNRIFEAAAAAHL